VTSTMGGTTSPPADLPTGATKTAQVRAMFDAIAPRYDLVNRVITLGLDRRWRARTLGALGLPAGSLVLDLACGTGDLADLARRSGHRVFGTDLSSGMLARRHHPFPAVQADAAALPIADGAVDGIVCGYALRNFTDLPGALAEAARVLRPGGRLAVLEVAAPPPGLLRRGFDLWFGRCVPAIGAVLSDGAAYSYLPRSTAYLPEEAELRRLVVSAGFSTVGRRLLNGGLSQLITATRRGMPDGSSS
jgi:demethylmenaquinone methyltransferase / 2-methoxy-6-polyprenyl-1,4-benzoquinol methylase